MIQPSDQICQVINRFNIRVYGLYLHPDQGLLVTDEIRGGMHMTKFPGGGLEFGEGLADCLKREFREELQTEIEVSKLIYVNEFLQPSAFNPKDQIISVYYYVNPMSDLTPLVSAGRFAFPEKKEGAQIFRFIPIHLLEEREFTFPIDRKVAGMLRGGMQF